MLYKSLLASALAPLALAMDYAVMVGDGGNVFTPSTVTGPMMGDTVTFMFSGSQHSVVESSFDEPCEPMSGGFSVGAQSKSINFTVSIMDSNTHWFYCSVPGHCNSGMVGVINPP
jgi:plastocyanin